MNHTMSSNSLVKFMDKAFEELNKSNTLSKVNTTPITPTTCCSDFCGSLNDQENVREYLQD